MEGPLTTPGAASLAGVLLALAGAIAAVVPIPVLSVTAGKPEPGRSTVLFAVPDRGRVALAYRHSLWGVTVLEIFEATAGGLRLIGVEAATPELDSYYHIPGARLVRQGAVYRLEVPPGPSVPEVRVRATPVGRRTLVVGGRCLQLERVGPEVVIRRMRVPLWRVWGSRWVHELAGRPEPCPRTMRTVFEKGRTVWRASEEGV